MKRPRYSRDGSLPPFLYRYVSKPLLAAFVIGAMFSTSVANTQAAGGVQSVLKNLTAAIITSFGITDDATNTIGLTQVDGGGLVNQSGEFDPVVADSFLGGSANVTAENQDPVVQIAGDGPNAQDIEVNGDATTDINATFGSTGSNDLEATQVAGAGDNINQDFTNGGSAESNLLIDLLAGSLNVFDMLQTAGLGPNAQSQEANAAATTNVTENITSFGGNVSNTTQVVSGDTNHNQHIGDIFNAITNVTVLQNLFSTNNTNLTMIANGDNNAMSAVVNPTAILNGDLTVDVSALNEITDTQVAGSGDNQNQDAETAVNASATGDIDQIGAATNTNDVTQTAGGDNVAQGVDLATDATSDMTMDAGVSAVNDLGSSIVQTMGSGDNHNQDADTSAAANVDGSATQNNNASNTSDTSQTGVDQVAQSVDGTLAANALADATVDFVGLNEIEVEQTTGSGDQHNQSADTSATADVTGDATQTNLASNDVDSSQTGSDQAAQGMDHSMTANGEANMDVLVSAGNDLGSTVSQVSGDGDNHNLDAGTSVAASTDGTATQNNAALNMFTGSQVGADQVAQGMDSTFVANADADMVAEIASLNDVEVEQTSGSGDQHNLSADTSAVADVTGVVDQISSGLNDVDASQVGANQAAQGMDNDLTANGSASLLASILGGNDIGSSITQTSGSGDQHNLAADTSADTTVDGTVGQDAIGSNLVELSQVGADNAAQGMGNTLATTAEAEAEVQIAGLNAIEVAQTSGSGDNHNLSADTSADADVTGTVDQISTALNALNASQVRADQAAQGMDNTVTSDAEGLLAASIVGGNDIGSSITQVTGAGNQHNLDADTTANADVDGDIGQVINADNFLEVSQVGANQAAQGMDNTVSAVADGAVLAEIEGTNAIEVEQTSGGGDNHNLAAGTTANAGVTGEVDNISTALNDVDASQVGADQAAQGMDNDMVATGNASLLASILGGNDIGSSVTQTTGSGDQHNLDADTEANTTVDGDVDQVAVGTNFLEADQVGANQAAQGMNNVMEANGNAEGLVQIAGLNAIEVEQTSGGGDQHNLSADTSATTDVTGVVEQIGTALNLIDASQVGADQAAQGMDNDVTADASAGLLAFIGGGNDLGSTVTQTTGTGDNHNLDATTTATTGVDGDIQQVVNADNFAGVVQVGSDNAAQGMDNTMVADGEAEALVEIEGLNTIEVAQTSGGGNQHNLSADTTAAADVAGEVDQISTALNQLGAAQVGTDNTAQGMDTDLTAGSDAGLLVSILGGNDVGSTVEQTTGTGDNHNLDAVTDVAATVDGDVGQVNVASNLAGQSQVGSDNTAQGMNTGLTANAEAGAAVSIAGLNAVEVSQTSGGGDQHNLFADTDAVANVGGVVGQVNAATNLADNSQVGADQAAQGMDSDFTANGVAGLLVAVGGVNDIGSTVTQVTGTGDNHNIHSEVDALADVDGNVGQLNTVTNAAEQDQVGSDQAAQGMDTTMVGNGEALALVTITGANEIEVEQTSGDGDQHKVHSEVGATADVDGSVTQANAVTNVADNSQVGLGQAAQGMDTALVGNGEAGLVAVISGINDVGSSVIQNSGSGDQHNVHSEADLLADVDGDVAQANSVINLLDQSQVGTDQAAQGMDTTMVGNAEAEAQVGILALNSMETVQNSGAGDQHNLFASTDATANVDGAVTQANAAVNASEQDQVGVDQAAQGMDSDMTTVASAGLAALIAGGNDIGSSTVQNGGTGENHNLSAETTALADVDGAVAQDNTAGNVSDKSQVGTNQAAQGMDDVLTAVADADAEVQIVGENIIETEQNSGAGDQHNLDADTTATALVSGDVSQDNESSNALTASQVGVDQAAQGMDSVMTAVANADLDALIGASNDVGSTVTQNAGSGDNHNLAATTDVLADIDGTVDQNNTASNSATKSQTGVDQAAQGMDEVLTAVASADGDITIGGENTVEVTQNSGAGDQHNLDADTSLTGLVTGAVTQANEASNEFVGTQVGTDQVAQDQAVNAVANADAGLEVLIGMNNDAGSTVTQNGGSGENHNLAADTTLTGDVDATVGQTNAASNVVTGTQVAAGEGAQNTETNPVANAAADMLATVGGVNTFELTQNSGAGDQHNQDANTSANVDVDADITQDNGANNTVNETQVCNGPVCAQGMTVNPVANAISEMDATVTGENDLGSTITQNGGAGDNQNQASDTTTNSSVGANVGQRNRGSNNLGLTQVCVGVVCALYMEANPVVNAVADMDTDVTGGNTVTNTQNGGSGDQQNQDLATNAGTDVDATVSQDNAGTNNLVLSQGCASIVCAMFVNTSPVVNADADMETDIAGTNEITDTQNGGAGDNHNQAIDNTAASEVDADIAQRNVGTNNVAVTQNCNSTVCAASAGINPVVNANADMDAATISQNIINGTQNAGAGDQHNQAIDQEATADNDTQVEQLNEGTNNVVLTQTCNSPTCAMGSEINPIANANSNLVLDSTAENEIDNTQNGGAGDNQNQAIDNTVNATNNTDVTAGNTAENNITATQVGNGTPSNQSNTTNATATSNSTFTINTGAKNTVNTTQNQ